MKNKGGFKIQRRRTRNMKLLKDNESTDRDEAEEEQEEEKVVR